MRDTLQIREVTFSPPLYGAPMAGLTHSAFRRLVADFGGGGAMCTEMLPPRAVTVENPHINPYLRRRPGDGRLIYQLMVTDTTKLAEAIQRLQSCQPDGLDVNCACPAPQICRLGAGGALFEDLPRLEAILRLVRREFAGPLSVKIRLGTNTPGWEVRLHERLRLFADCGVDWLILHPRFADEKLKRRPRHELYPWIKTLTALPLVGNGDILTPEFPQTHAAPVAALDGIMLGRIVAAQPWIFRTWQGQAPTPDYATIWQRFTAYVEEDFNPNLALGRVKIFTAYYARNFKFGQQLFVAVQSARTLADARDRATLFFTRNPECVTTPNFSGV